LTLGTLLPFLVLIVAFYFLILRPARTRQTAQAAVRSKLEPGVEAMTTSGLFGTVTAIDGDKVSLEIAPGVTVRFVAAAIASVVTAPAAEGTTEPTQASITEDDTPGA
jgi:preprotein translocase subunit YajC